MRAVLPHLRLLTLKLGQLSLLSKYLTAEEKVFLAGRMVFRDESSSELAVPSTLNSSTTPRARANSPDSTKIWNIPLIPENLIIRDHFKMGGQPVNKIRSKSNQREMFCVDLVKISRDMCLAGIEILTQANNLPELKPSANSKG